jgi:ATP synthase F1 gamma subunit
MSLWTSTRLGQKATTVTTTIVVITGKCSLCGSYHPFMTKKAEGPNPVKAQGNELDLILIGNKKPSYSNRCTHPIRYEFECTQNPDSKHALAISEKIINSSLSGKTDFVKILYTNFVSLIASIPRVHILAPFSVKCPQREMRGSNSPPPVATLEWS